MILGCLKPDNFTNGVYVDSLNNFYVEKEEVNFSCNSGYAPRPETSTIVCGEDGWDVLPICFPGNFLLDKKKHFKLHHP